MKQCGSGIQDIAQNNRRQNQDTYPNIFNTF